MAIVDFTLEDVRRVVVGDVRNAVVDDVRSIVVDDVRKVVVDDVRNIIVDMRKVIIEDVGNVIDERFQLFENKYDDDMRAIQYDLTVIIKRLDVVERDSVSTRRLVDKHSKDIMQLRAAVEH